MYLNNSKLSKGKSFWQSLTAKLLENVNKVLHSRKKNKLNRALV